MPEALSPSRDRLPGDLALLVIEASGAVSFAHGAALEAIGLPAQARAGESVLDILPHDSPMRLGLEKAMAGRPDRFDLNVGNTTFDVRFESRPTGGAVVLAINAGSGRHAEDELRASGPYLRLIFRQIPGLIWSTDRDLRIQYAEGRVLATAGFDFNQALGKTVQEIVAARDPTEPAVARHRAALAGQPQSFRYEFRGRWFEMLIEPLHADDTDIIGCVGAAVDVTDRKRGEEELTESVQKLERARSLLEATVNSTADGLLVVDLDGKVAKYNQQFLALWRIPKTLAEQRDDERLVAFVVDQLEDPDSFRRGVREVYGYPERESFDVLRFKDGRVFERYSMPQRIGDTVAGRVWSFRDVTERERLLRRAMFLADAARLLDSLDVETALDSVAHMAVPYLGDGCAIDLLGNGGPRRVAVAARDPAHPVNPDLHSAILAGHPAIYAVGPFSYMAVPLVVKDSVVGGMTFVAPPGRRYTAQDLELAEVLARKAAVSVENAHLYRDARQALRARDEFLSVAAHEIRGPVTSMHLAVQSLQQGKIPAAARSNVLEIIAREDRRLGRFVDDLLDLGRIRTGRLYFTLEEVDLGDVVRDVAASSGTEITRSGSSLSITTTGHLVGQWDQFRLEQVVNNLLLNAIKFGLGKPIVIAVSARDGRVTLEVTDQGVGIAPEMQDKIFEPFERAVSVRNYGGLGLGLHIVKTIVQGLGGSVRVESQPGRGSSFIVELPRVRP